MFQHFCIRFPISAFLVGVPQRENARHRQNQVISISGPAMIQGSASFTHHPATMPIYAIISPNKSQLGYHLLLSHHFPTKFPSWFTALYIIPWHTRLTAPPSTPRCSKALQFLSSLRPCLLRRGLRGRHSRVFDDVVDLPLHLVPGRRSEKADLLESKQVSKLRDSMRLTKLLIHPSKHHKCKEPYQK